MNYSKEKEQFQKVFGGILKRRYKSIVEVEVNPEDFEEIMEYGKDYPFRTLGVTVNWKVQVSIKNNETFGNLSSLGQDIFHAMFKIKGVVPWIHLETNYES
jgi:hypothetical protein